MTYEQYWYGDPKMCIYFRDAHEYYREQKNQEMFMQARYNYEAFQTALNMFSYGLNGGKGKKPAPFRDRPYAVTDREKEAEQERLKKYTLDWVAKGQIDGNNKS